MSLTQQEQPRTNAAAGKVLVLGFAALLVLGAAIATWVFLNRVPDTVVPVGGDIKAPPGQSIEREASGTSN